MIYLVRLAKSATQVFAKLLDEPRTLLLDNYKVFTQVNV